MVHEFSAKRAPNRLGKRDSHPLARAPVLGRHPANIVNLITTALAVTDIVLVEKRIYCPPLSVVC